MRSLSRTRAEARDPLARDVLSMVAAISIVGASLGALAVSKGFPLWLVTLMATIVFAGGSELMIVGMLTAGAAPLTVVLGALMLNARHFPFGLALGDVLGRNLPERLFGSHIMVDESVAFALAETDPARRRRAYWISGLALFCTWTPSVFLGGLIGQGVGDPAVLGLDAALPAGLFALVAPRLRDQPTLRAVLLGGLVAVATAPVLPEGMPMMVAIVGVAAALPLPKGVRR